MSKSNIRLYRALRKSLPQEQQELDFTKIVTAKHWQAVKDFWDQTNFALNGAYLLYRRGEHDYYEDAMGWKIPPLDKENKKQWIAATELEPFIDLKPTILATYRNKGIKPNENENQAGVGIGMYGRVWRKAESNRVYYFIPSLSEKVKSILAQKNQ